jgi:hypothetical protein
VLIEEGGYVFELGPHERVTDDMSNVHAPFSSLNGDKL